MLGKMLNRLQARRRTQVPATTARRTPAIESLVLENLRRTISVLEIPALVIDDAGHVRCYNAGCREIFPSIADGQPMFQVSRNPGLVEAVARARELGSAQTGEMANRGVAGRRVRVTVSPLNDSGYAGERADGREGTAVASHLLVQFRDLSEQDRLAQLRSDFIANASHELRTPLASLKGFIETLQGPAQNDSDARTRFLTIMEAQAARMARILDDLLSLSRIEMRAPCAANR